MPKLCDGRLLVHMGQPGQHRIRTIHPFIGIQVLILKQAKGSTSESTYASSPVQTAQCTSGCSSPRCAPSDDKS
eukprot:2476379-Amphidinium_carterae.1